MVKKSGKIDLIVEWWRFISACFRKKGIRPLKVLVNKDSEYGSALSRMMLQDLNR